MLPAGFPSQDAKVQDPLLLLQDRLAQAVAGHEKQCMEEVKQALAGIEGELRQRIVPPDTPDGLSPEIDCTRASLARRADELRRRLEVLLARTMDLSQRVAAGADFETVRGGAEDLLAGLEQIEEAETDLVQESVNTDLGVGD
jgi:hypothetical protein